MVDHVMVSVVSLYVYLLRSLIVTIGYVSVRFSGFAISFSLWMEHFIWNVKVVR